jgi:hypothetical protein
MNEEHVAKALAVHVEELIGRPETVQRISLTGKEHGRLISLLQLAERLHRNMQPVQPSAAFVRNLGKELADQAKRQITLAKRLRRAVLIGAAALGSLLSIASLVGAIIFVIARLRERTHARVIQAPTG